MTDLPEGSEPPRILLLGVPEVAGARGPAPTMYVAGRAAASHTARATELIGYLAAHRRGVTTTQLSLVHSPDVLRSPATLHSLVSRMRRWLGTDEHGVPWLPRTKAGHVLVLDHRVRSDWEDFRALTGPEVAATSTESLAAALRLVRAQPLSGAPPGRWGWAEDLRQEMIDAVGDVCHELAWRHLSAADFGAARRAAALGRTLDPTDERLWRDALTIELRAGDAEAQRRLIAQLVRVVDRAEVDDETAALIAGVEGRRASTGRPLSPTARGTV